MPVMSLLLIHRVPVLEIFEMVQGLFAVEDPDVLGLGWSQATHSPAKVDEVRLDRSVQRVHPDLIRQVVRLASVAWAASGDDVRPVVGAAA